MEKKLAEIELAKIEAGPGAAAPLDNAGSDDNLCINLTKDKGFVKREDFELLKVIGRGGFAKVFLVRKKDNGKIYAMKVISKRGVVRKNRAQYVIRERNILKDLNHPFIVKLHYAFQNADNLYLILDYLPGGELFELLFKMQSFSVLNNCLLPEKDVRFYAAELVLAIEYLHGLDIVHRDLKPNNILLDSEGHINLLDFGLAKDAIKDQKLLSFCGTVQYMAPEMLTSTGYGKSVDWWSLGVLVYQLISGEMPFDCKNRNELYNMIMKAQPKFDPKIFSKNAQDLVTKLLERDINKRLGCGKKGADEIKRHPFFKGVKWSQVLQRKMAPPLKPEITSEVDVNNFDPKITAMKPTDSVLDYDDSDGEHGEDPFRCFSFARPVSVCEPIR